MDRLLDDLNEASRLVTQMNELHICLMGDKDIGSQGLISVLLGRYTEAMYGHKDYPILEVADYLAKIDKFMATQVRRQLSGLMMLLLITKGSE